MLKTYDFHSFIQRPHFSQIAKNDFRASFFTPADIAAYSIINLCFSRFRLKRDEPTDKPTDEPTDEPTDQRTDKAS